MNKIKVSIKSIHLTQEVYVYFNLDVILMSKVYYSNNNRNIPLWYYLDILTKHFYICFDFMTFQDHENHHNLMGNIRRHHLATVWGWQYLCLFSQRNRQYHGNFLGIHILI